MGKTQLNLAFIILAIISNTFKLMSLLSYIIVIIAVIVLFDFYSLLILSITFGLPMAALIVAYRSNIQWVQKGGEIVQFVVTYLGFLIIWAVLSPLDNPSSFFYSSTKSYHLVNFLFIFCFCLSSVKYFVNDRLKQKTIKLPKLQAMLIYFSACCLFIISLLLLINYLQPTPFSV